MAIPPHSLTSLPQALGVPHSDLPDLIALTNIDRRVQRFSTHTAFRQPHGMTLLEKVIHEGHWDHVTTLLHLGSNVNHRDETGSTVLHSLVHLSQERHLPDHVLHKLVTPHNINCKAWNDVGGRGRGRGGSRRGGLAALHLAAFEANHQLVKGFVQCGADITVVTSQGLTPLHVAVTSFNEIPPHADVLSFHNQQCMSASYDDVIEPLVSAETINKKSRNGKTALHMAAHCSCVGIIDLLVRKGASVNTRDKYGCTPMAYCFGSYLPSLLTVELLTPEDPLQMYIAVIFQFGYGISDERLEVMELFLARLRPVVINSVAVMTGFDPPLLHVNSVRTNLLWKSYMVAIVKMLCHFLTTACTGRGAEVVVHGPQGGLIYDTMHSLGTALNSQVPSLRKLSVLVIRQVVLAQREGGRGAGGRGGGGGVVGGEAGGKGAEEAGGGDFDRLGLPTQMVELVKWKRLGLELRQIWDEQSSGSRE